MLDSNHPDAALEARRHDPGPPSDFDRVRRVLDALPEAVFVVDDDGELRLTNPAADQLFAGRPIHDRADLLSRFEAITPGRESDPDGTPRTDSPRPVTVRSRHRPNRWYALRTIPLADGPSTSSGSVAGAEGSPASGTPASATTGATDATSGDGPGAGQTVFVLRDVTDTRDVQPEREAFLSVLSHELRTPITTIYAGSSVLARRPTLSPPESEVLARDISAEAARLYDLVEDLLVLARLERQVLDPLDESVFLHRTVDATIRAARDRAPGASIKRTGTGHPPAVHGDATYVEQACRNLVLTSLRFAEDDPGRGLTVDLTTDEAAGEVRVAVRDPGPALSDNEIAGAFELPDPASVGRLAGAGIGPFVCRHLIEAMGGRVWALNREDDGGVEFGFSLRIDDRG